MKKARSEPREQLINGMEEEIRELEGETEIQETRLEDSDWDPKTDYEKPVDEIKIGLRDLRERLGEIGSAREADWEALYEEAEEELVRLGDRLKNLTSDIDNLILE